MPAQRANHRFRGAPLIGQGVLTVALPLGATLVFNQFTPMSALLILVLHLTSLTLILIYLGRGLPNTASQTPSTHSLRALSFGQAGQVLLNHMDVLVLGWLISPTEAGIYLIARRLTGLAGLAFDALRSASAPALAVAFKSGPARTIATRVNRIFLLAGLGGGGLLWIGAPFTLALFGATQALDAFHYLLLGALTPAIFGATGLLLVMGDLEGGHAKLVFALLPVSLSVLIWSSSFGITGLALGAAFVQMTMGAAAATFLMRHHGIRPGIFLQAGALENISRTKQNSK